jgi:N-hydroxyarylamine O-acetyltransferase
MDVSVYLDRIGYQGPRAATVESLRSLHRAHMFTVPFENLDIGLGRPILCDEARFLHKIVDELRGGFCYELNGAFAALLRELGFTVTLLSARVSRNDGSEGPDFDHMTLLVDLEHRWLADVGFGDSFVEPLRMELGVEQNQSGRIYRVTLRDGRNRYAENLDRTWKERYSFTLEARRVPEFAAMCHYQQTSPDSHFTRQKICSLATPDGRITLTGDKLIETRNGEKQERVVDSVEWQSLLMARFGIRLPA